MTKLTVQLVTWNGAKYIPFLFESLKNQTFSDWKLVVLDNGSSDATVDAIEKEIRNWKLETSIFLVKNETNLGFAGGHNKLFQEYSDSEYVLLLNQDMYLEPDCLETMAAYLDEQENVAAVSPRLMRWNHESLVTNQHDLVENSFSDYVDALGLEVFRNRRVIEQYTGKKWSELAGTFKSNELPVFGVSGAFPMLRRSALDYVAFEDGTFLDSSYHSYKEDVDLAFRLVSAGYEARVLLDTVAYHDRSGAGPEDMADSAAARNKKEQSSWIKYHSYKNHLMTLYKNEYWQNWMLDAIFIKWYELKKFVWFLLFDRSVLKGLGEVWKLRKTLRKRKLEIRNRRRASWKEMRQWWT